MTTNKALDCLGVREWHRYNEMRVERYAVNCQIVPFNVLVVLLNVMFIYLSFFKLQHSRNVKDKKYPRLSEEIPLDVKWLPLLDYLSTFGMKESHFVQMYERRMQSLQINVCSAQERLEYLLSIGVKQRDVRRILLRQPQILEYTVENNLKSHVAFLRGLGIPNSRIGQIIAAAPSLFSYSVENSLKPTVSYLIEEVGIKEKDLGKVIQLSPQILVQRIDISWNTRCMFLTKELGAPRDSIVKMVTKHPQLLHYSIDDGLLPRINFLRSIGMKNSDILKVLTSLTQVILHVFASLLIYENYSVLLFQISIPPFQLMLFL